MALYDPVERRLCIRVVYDGVSGAGKTTNLRMLSGLFSAQRSAELYSPGEADGHTLFFDWLQIMAGSVCGVPLTCQLISVPGQLVLTPRRRHLLSVADAVVFVCDSSTAGAERGRQALGVVDAVAPRPTRFVVQANKQDQADAVGGHELLARLGRPEASVVEAIAVDGIGVLDTFLHAVRLVSRAMQDQSERGELRLTVARAPSAAQLLARVRREEVDPEWAAEMCLEEALTALMLEGAGRAEARGAGGARARQAELAPPPPPTPDVPAGCIWPAHTGRGVLRAVSAGGLREAACREDASGRVVLTSPTHLLVTSRSARFETRDEARQALVRSARQRTQLGSLLVPETVLVAQPGADESFWIWTVAPRLPAVDASLLRAPGARALVEAYGAAVAEALVVSAKHGLSLDLRPPSFGERGGAVHYTGPVGGDAPADGSLVAAVGGAAAALVELGADVEPFFEAFGREVHARLTGEVAARLVDASAPSSSAHHARVQAVLASVSADAA